ADMARELKLDPELRKAWLAELRNHAQCDLPQRQAGGRPRRQERELDVAGEGMLFGGKAIEGQGDLPSVAHHTRLCEPQEVAVDGPRTSCHEDLSRLDQVLKYRSSDKLAACSQAIVSRRAFSVVDMSTSARIPSVIASADIASTAIAPSPMASRCASLLL